MAAIKQIRGLSQVKDVAPWIIVGIFAAIPILLISISSWQSNYQSDARKLIPSGWNPDYVFKSFPMLVVNAATREIAIIDRKKATIVGFDNIKSWRHQWTNKVIASSGITSAKIRTTRTNQFVTIVALGMSTPSINISSSQCEQICDVLEIYLR